MLLIGLSDTSLAHPVSINWVNATIEGERIAVKYRILCEDLVNFYRPACDEYFNYETNELKKLGVEHGRLIQEQFQILQNNQVLKSKLVSVNDNSLPSTQVGVMDLMKYPIVYHLVFELNDEHWESLTFDQKLGEYKSGLPTITFFSLFDDGEILVDQRELDSEPLVLARGEKVSNKSDSELTSSYFSLSSEGVRHELTIPRTTFTSLLVQSEISGDDFVDNVIKYFNTRNNVYNDGNKLSPQLAHFSMLTNDDSGSGLIYMDIKYPMVKNPDDLKLTWNDFNWKFKWFDSKIYTLDSLYLHTFSRFQKEIMIKSSLTENKE